MHQTVSDRFGATDYNMSEDRPAFQRASNQYNMDTGDEQLDTQ
jgi:alpha-tubulin suppressor-like RCC1 family protein